jgi:hypothetical protein
LLIEIILSFFDKKDLTNGIDGFILCAMNANEISPKANARLNRIRIVSRIIRYVILGLFIFTAGYFLLHQFVMSSPRAWLDNLGYKFTMVLMEGVLCFWYWKLAKLFQFYERGLIFAAETIRCIKTLGVLCVINWLLTSVGIVLRHLSQPPPLPPPGVTIKIIPSSFSMGFFSFSIDGINVGLLLAGIIIVIIAWIMDEGRKIQEEQELTV